AGPDVDHGTHGGTGTSDAAEEAGDGVANALANQFLVGVVACAGHVVRHQGCQQAVDGTEQGEYESRLHDHGDGVTGKLRHVDAWQAGGDVTKNRHAADEDTDQG